MSSSENIALVSGASSGIGYSIAKKLLSEGYKVLALARRSDRLEQLASDTAAGGRLVSLCCDLRDQQATREQLSAIPRDFRDITVLVNNAGLALGVATADRADFNDWQTMIDTNCTALAWLTREILPGMLARNRGHIVNMGSTAGGYPYRGGNVYGASKAFVHHFSLNLRADLLGTPIRCTLIEPGLVGGSEFSLVRFKGDQAKAMLPYEGTEELTPEAVSDAVFFALSQPANVNINRIEIMPVCQAADAINVIRNA